MSFERPNGPTFFGDKDTLPTGNAGKVIKGSEVDADFNAISTEINAMRDEFSIVAGDIPGIEAGASDSETLAWSDSSSKWVSTGVLKVKVDGVEVSGSISCTGSVSADDYEIRNRSYTLSDFIDEQLASNQNVYGKVVELEIKVDNHENRIDDLEEFEQAQLGSNQNVYDQLLTHSLQIEALQNSSFEALSASNTFEEFKQKMTAVLSQMIVDSKKSTFERPER